MLVDKTNLRHFLSLCRLSLLFYLTSDYISITYLHFYFHPLFFFETAWIYVLSASVCSGGKILCSPNSYCPQEVFGDSQFFCMCCCCSYFALMASFHRLSYAYKPLFATFPSVCAASPLHTKFSSFNLLQWFGFLASLGLFSRVFPYNICSPYFCFSYQILFFPFLVDDPEIRWCFFCT